MKSVEEIRKEVERIHKSLKRAHEAIDDYYSGRNAVPMMGFGPYAQSQVIAGCNKQLAELRKELINLGLTDKEADEMTREEPPSGYVYEKCMEFLAVENGRQILTGKAAS